MVVNTPNFGVDNLSEYLGRVDNKLKSLTPEHIGGVERLLQAHGKRLRPSLVIAIAYHSGKEIDDTVITAASAVELIHFASLVHDDIMDNGTLRWGVPTINATEGNDMALLAGDYLLSKGCALAASISAEAGVIMAETIARLCTGQALELKDQFNTGRTVKSLNLAIKGKTCSLFVAACRIGGLVAGLKPKQIQAMTGFAENFGLAFQYMDDVQDFTKSLKEGKSASSDIEAGNYTLPVILSLQRPHKSALKKLLLRPDASAEEILEVLKIDESIKKTIDEAQGYYRKASEYLSKAGIDGLKTLHFKAFHDMVNKP